MPNGVMISVNDTVKYKDVSLGAFSGNTWYYYSVANDSDLSSKVIMGAFFVDFESSVYINTSIVYNSNNNRFYYGASGNQTGTNCKLRILYKDF